LISLFYIIVNVKRGTYQFENKEKLTLEFFFKHHKTISYLFYLFSPRSCSQCK